MKKVVTFLLFLILVSCAACSTNTGYVLNEQTFFLVMTNMQYYPEQYLGEKIEFDCFSYELTDVNGNRHICGVRKCSSGYGCNCGKDTVIGFLLEYDKEIPLPRNQSENTNDKTWLHITGNLKNQNKTEIKIYAYNEDNIDYGTVESVYFLSFVVETVDLIEDYSNLHYYVTK